MKDGRLQSEQVLVGGGGTQPGEARSRGREQTAGGKGQGS